MQNNDLEKLLDDLGNDLSNKNERPNLNVKPKQESSQGAASGETGFSKSHRNIILGVVTGLVVLFGVYQFGVNNSKQEANTSVVRQTEQSESKKNLSNNKSTDTNSSSAASARAERARNVQYSHYKPTEYLDDNPLYPQVYVKQGVHYYLDLSTAVVDKEITLQDGGKIYQFSVLSITSDKITKSTKIMHANVYIGGSDALPAYLDKGQWKKLEYLGATAVGYNTALLLTDYFAL